MGRDALSWRGCSRATPARRPEYSATNVMRADSHPVCRRPVPGWRKFLVQLTDVLVILLIVAGMVSGGLWFYERDAALPYEALAIFAIVLLNAILGYVQLARADQVAALQSMAKGGQLQPPSWSRPISY